MNFTNVLILIFFFKYIIGYRKIKYKIELQYKKIKMFLTDTI